MDTQLFASKIRQYRETLGQSITDVANSIGVDRSYLSKLENGHEKPSLSVLSLLIRHFSLSEVEAIELSKLIGNMSGGSIFLNYKKKEVREEMDNLQVKQVPEQEVQVNLAADRVPILYTDSVFINSNQYGIVLNVAQSTGPTSQQNVVARIGMSREHAKALLDVLGKHLAMTTSSSKKQ